MPLHSSLVGSSSISETIENFIPDFTLEDFDYIELFQNG